MSTEIVEEPVCLNCGGPVPLDSRPVRKLFCSPVCKQAAKAVRYVRAKRAEGIEDRPDIAEAIRIKLGFAIGDGYPEAKRRLNTEQRAEVFERDGFKCAKCGGPATEIDHLRPQPGTQVNDFVNLQSLCHDCHVQKTLSSFRPLEGEDELRMYRALLERIDADEPMLLCDTPEWNDNWRRFEKLRKEASLGW